MSRILGRTDSVPPTDSPGTPDDRLTWEYDLPLLTNWLVMRDLSLALGGGLAFVTVIIVGATVLEGKWSAETAVGLARAMGIVAAIVVALALFAVLIVMRNRAHCTFTLDRAGVTCASGRRERAINRIAIAVGLLAGRPSLAGAGFIGISREVEFVPWRDVHRLQADPRKHVISLSSARRVIVQLYCPPDRFDEILAFVQPRIAAMAVRRQNAARRAAHRPRRPLPIRPPLLWAISVLIATAAALAWPWMSDATGPLALLAGLLVLLAGLAPGLRRLAGLLGAGASFWLIGSLAFAAMDGIESPRGQVIGYVWQLASERLVLAIAGSLMLLGLALWRLLGPGPATRESGRGHARPAA